MIYLFIIVVVLLFFEGIFRPRLDIDMEGQLIMWYNKKRHGILTRKFIILM